jgi:hypothetical protein
MLPSYRIRAEHDMNVGFIGLLPPEDQLTDWD